MEVRGALKEVNKDVFFVFRATPSGAQVFFPESLLDELRDHIACQGLYLVNSTHCIIALVSDKRFLKRYLHFHVLLSTFGLNSLV